jgi:hypothetical protein
MQKETYHALNGQFSQHGTSYQIRDCLARGNTMHMLLGALVPIIITVAVALIIWFVAERFSPDPLITKIGEAGEEH